MRIRPVVPVIPAFLNKRRQEQVEKRADKIAELREALEGFRRTIRALESGTDAFDKDRYDRAKLGEQLALDELKRLGATP